MKKNEVTITKEWYEGLVESIDKLKKQIESNKRTERRCHWIYYLDGYVHSLDQLFEDNLIK